mmetsp:Transcript_10339/g.38097  ORF Transcript_10339/g.38097 Transcript_10339/m.38097 type:complete len:207 (-) Transcript_10339:1672-2292(-)
MQDVACDLDHTPHDGALTRSKTPLAAPYSSRWSSSLVSSTSLRAVLISSRRSWSINEEDAKADKPSETFCSIIRLFSDAAAATSSSVTSSNSSTSLTLSLRPASAASTPSVSTDVASALACSASFSSASMAACTSAASSSSSFISSCSWIKCWILRSVASRVSLVSSLMDCSTSLTTSSGRAARVASIASTASDLADCMLRPNPPS